MAGIGRKGGETVNVIPNLTKKKCAEGKVVIGAALRIARTMDVGVALKACGYDFIFIDTEHGTVGLDAAAQLSVAALGHGITPLVRVPSLEGHLGSRVLDGGAQGIILPHVNSGGKASEFVSVCRFPPLGRRPSRRRLLQRYSRRKQFPAWSPTT